MKIEGEVMECLTAIVGEVQKKSDLFFFKHFQLVELDLIWNVILMTQRRQVGFIKTYNHTQTNFQEEPSEFSYFRVKPKDDDEEFSPYKF